MEMRRTELWKNFRLGEELTVSGAFIYNGVRSFYELRSLDQTDEVFEVFYYLSIGLERLMKIAIILLEHDDATDQEAFETSLITHSHHELLGRIKAHTAIDLGSPGNDLLGLLTTFYKSLRYDRFSLNSPMTLGKESERLLAYLSKHLGVKFEKAEFFSGHANEARFRRFMRKTVLKTSSALYEIVQRRSRELNLYTYELRHGSKAQTVFLGEADIETEDVLWKELLVFLMNTKSKNGYIKFLRSIEPLGFDPAMTGDYLDCFQSDSAKSLVVGELETLYEDVPDKAERLQMMDLIGNPNADFSDDDEEAEDIDDEDWLDGIDDDDDPETQGR